MRPPGNSKGNGPRISTSEHRKERTDLLENPEQSTQPEPERPTASASPAEAPAAPTNGNGPATARRDAPPAAPGRKYYTITELTEAKPKDLLAIAKEFSVTDIDASMNKQDVVTRILQAQTEAQGNIFAQGILEIVEDGFGFLRQRTLLPSPNDVYVGSSQVRRLG